MKKLDSFVIKEVDNIQSSVQREKFNKNVDSKKAMNKLDLSVIKEIEEENDSIQHSVQTEKFNKMMGTRINNNVDSKKVFKHQIKTSEIEFIFDVSLRLTSQKLIIKYKQSKSERQKNEIEINQ